MDKKFFVISCINEGSVATLVKTKDFETNLNGCIVGDYIVSKVNCKLYIIDNINKVNDGAIINYSYVMDLKNPFVADGILNTYYIEQQIKNKHDEEIFCTFGCFLGFIFFILLCMLPKWLS